MYENILKDALNKLVEDFNSYSELVALNYANGENKGKDWNWHNDGVLQWNRGSLNKTEEYLKSLAEAMGVSLCWDCSEHDFGHDDWKQKLTYKTVKIAD